MSLSSEDSVESESGYSERRGQFKKRGRMGSRDDTTQQFLEELEEDAMKKREVFRERRSSSKGK